MQSDPPMPRSVWITLLVYAETYSMKKNFPRWRVRYAGNKDNSAPLELELGHGLSLAIVTVAKPALSNLGTPSSSNLYVSFEIN